MTAPDCDLGEQALRPWKSTIRGLRGGSRHVPSVLQDSQGSITAQGTLVLSST